MQKREFNLATFEMANNRDISGRATADEINRGLRIGKERSFWRVASLTFLRSFTMASLLVAVVPLPARADNGEDSRHGREDNEKQIRAEITALKAQVAVLQNQVNSLQTSNTTLQRQLANAKNVLALDPFVRVDPNPEIGVIGPNITFTGANIHIVSGSGSTNDNGNPTGLGNLIIGYDEDPGNPTEGPEGPGPVGPGEGHPPTFPLQPGDRSGSHNLVIGSWHRFTRAAFGGFVAGELNVIGGEGASVSGGGFNTSNGRVSSVSGGGFNTASGLQAVVTGGSGNTASGFEASVLGGTQNTADSDGFVGPPIVGATVVGGEGNTASGQDTVVLGGQNITDNNNNSIAPQPPFP